MSRLSKLMRIGLDKVDLRESNQVWLTHFYVVFRNPNIRKKFRGMRLHSKISAWAHKQLHSKNPDFDISEEVKDNVTFKQIHRM